MLMYATRGDLLTQLASYLTTGNNMLLTRILQEDHPVIHDSEPWQKN